MRDDTLLSIRGLRVEFPTQDGPLVAVNNVDLDVTRGEVLYRRGIWIWKDCFGAFLDGFD